MDNATYRKNVFKTLSIKPAKLGLKLVSRNTNRTNIFHTSTGVATEGAEFVIGLTPYLLGISKLTDAMKSNAFEEMGDLGYYITALAKCVKAKLPGSGKRLKLKGMTRSEAVMQLFAATAEIGDLAKKTFYGPKMVEVERVKVVNEVDASGAVVGKSQVSVKTMAIDVEKTNELFDSRVARIKEILEVKIVPLYWALCYDLFEVPPSNVYVGNIAKLSKRYGEGFFTLAEAEDRDTDAEIEEMSTAASA